MNSDQKSPRFLIKLNTDAVKVNSAFAQEAIVSRLQAQGDNVDKEAAARDLQDAVFGNPKDPHAPVWLVLNAQDKTDDSPWQCFFVWGWKAKNAESAFGAQNSPSGPSVFATDDLDVQLTKGGEFVSLAVALETGTAKWAGWEAEYRRAGLLETEEVDEKTTDGTSN